MGHSSAFVALLLFYSLNYSLLVASQVTECTTGELHTVLGDNGRDYLLYCYNGEWRRMCSGGRTWGDMTVTVACRQLGYSDLISRGNACSGTETNDEVRLSARCDGMENRLQDCGEGIVEMPCDCGSQAYLDCQQSNCADGEIRLVNGSTNREGRVEVCMDGRWGTVCNNSQEGIAGAVCTQLGFSRQDATTVNSFGPGFVPIRSCLVTEEGNLTCIQITDASCDHSMDLGVVCITYEQLYNELRDQESNMQCTQSTVTPGDVSGAVSASERGSTCGSDNCGVLIAVVVVLGVLLIAMATGWICSCVFLMKKLNNSETSAIKTAAVTTEERQLHNPVYDGTTQQMQAVPKPGPTYETVQSQKAKVTSPVPGAAEVTYDVADERGGVTYSVVGEAADTNSQPYNVLVHNTERSHCFVPQEDYSTLQA